MVEIGNPRILFAIHAVNHRRILRYRPANSENRPGSQHKKRSTTPPVQQAGRKDSQSYVRGKDRSKNDAAPVISRRGENQGITRRSTVGLGIIYHHATAAYGCRLRISRAHPVIYAANADWLLCRHTDERYARSRGSTTKRSSSTMSPPMA